MASNYNSTYGAFYGPKLYPSPREHPGRFKYRGPLHRDIKQAISPFDWAQMVELSAKLCARIPALRGAIRQKSEWAFAGDSWQPIYYGSNEKWGDIATDWLVHQVFPNALRGNVRKDLIKGLQVSGMGWDIHGDDLALFVCDQQKDAFGKVINPDAKPLPQMVVIPGTRIGNGPPAQVAGAAYGWLTVSGGSYSVGGYSLYGMGYVVGGRFEGLRIYNGIIIDDSDEPVAARVLGMKRDPTAKGGFITTYNDFPLGFANAAHLASEYEWHEMGRPLPRIAASVLHWLNKEQIDENILKEIDLASKKFVIHKLAEGQDAMQSRGDSAQQITVTDQNGNEQTIMVDTTQAGDVTYISSGEDLEQADFAFPHPNMEDFARRILSECLQDLGWPYELTDLSSTGRAPTRLSCELVNNSLWQKQVTGETRLFWFTKFAIAQGIKFGHISAPPGGALDDAYKWTFGYPKEMSVDAGNDVTASLARLRFGLTSQRVESARWGHVLKRIQSDRLKESFLLVDNAAAMKKYAQSAGIDLPDEKALEYFYQTGSAPVQLPKVPEKFDDPEAGAPPDDGQTPSDEKSNPATSPAKGSKK